MRIHYFAAARAAAGVSAEDTSPRETLGLVLDDAAGRHPDLAPILARCSFLVDGKRADADAPLAGAQRVDVLPPFAGG